MEVRHLWGALWWTGYCYAVCPTAHPDIVEYGVTPHEAVGMLENRLASLGADERAALVDGSYLAPLSSSYHVVRIAVREPPEERCAR